MSLPGFEALPAFHAGVAAGSCRHVVSGVFGLCLDWVHGDPVHCVVGPVSVGRGACTVDTVAVCIVENEVCLGAVIYLQIQVAFHCILCVYLCLWVDRDNYISSGRTCCGQLVSFSVIQDIDTFWLVAANFCFPLFFRFYAYL
uniref:Uncharacterized protein n=1 Tax=Oryza brachyantha TaxID=4533 RepID=J3M8Z3_ORYBR